MKRSIRKHILLILLAAQGVVTGGCVTALVAYVNRQRADALDSEIQRRASLLIPMVQIDDHNHSKILFMPVQDALFSEDLFEITAATGEIVGASSRSLADVRRLRRMKGSIFTLTLSGKRFRARSFTKIPVFIDVDEDGKPDFLGQRIDILYAVPISAFDTTTREITILAVLGGLFWIATSCLIAWYSVTRGMVPLGELATQASGITERNWWLPASPELRRVSELHPLVQALEKLLLRLRAAFERERTFFNDAAHELKTIVAIQKSSLQVTLRGPASQYREGLERVSEDVDRLDLLVHRMLSLASIETSDHLNFSLVPLEDSILGACDQLRPVATAHQVAMDVQVGAGCSVSGDPDLLQNLWITLLENAIRYSPPDTSIRISAELVNGCCVVSVRDQGAGIAPESLPYLFERFYRADISRARKTGGFGLGLAMAKAIVVRHQGEIAIASELGIGTTLTVKLPSPSHA